MGLMDIGKWVHAWEIKATKRVVCAIKDGLQISWASEIDDGIELALKQGHGGLER